MDARLYPQRDMRDDQTLHVKNSVAGTVLSGRGISPSPRQDMKARETIERSLALSNGIVSFKPDAVIVG